ncbi:sulfurtransferase [Thermaerobacillus caldiproteolyticus]|uniref:Thiosulfate/3-mercaptopyruvate sulfurtransferase n=1 Tax=Thermaerobacillus caldiproteolyticus TaxID=247480 RepID=A0A7W0BYA2_9BACL|nr:sulfurtransferase [Anoxybacillus caldiproteolyticus]MBA2875481.1 thiosulfate/3-mercaptopyruvate sulfurtransferase [Anoxybacillus caldiproteolyticus]
MNYIVSHEWLAERLHDDNVRIIDCRFYLGDASRGINEYIRDHIPGALYFDLEKDLSGPVQEHGGRHPLPSIDDLVTKLSSAGIDGTMTVVAYDEQDGAMAARFWWLLRYLGHERVYVLDGGYTRWKEAGYPTTSDIITVKKRSFLPALQPSLLATVDDVRHAVHESSAILIDSRERKRYSGIEEPIDRIAGHIPGAQNIFWRESVTSEGKWKQPSEQEKRFASFRKKDPIIVYCGSGVTACPNVLALYEAGYTNVRLYVGSWSDWISYPDNPIATGEK